VGDKGGGWNSGSQNLLRVGMKTNGMTGEREPVVESAENKNGPTPARNRYKCQSGLTKVIRRVGDEKKGKKSALIFSKLPD